MTPLDLANRVAYGATFVVGVPLLLVVWTIRTAPAIPLPRVGNAVVGVLIALAGLLLTTAGITALIRHGRGLPMNAFPPEQLVRDGVFRWVRNPIYVGFGLVVLGVALAARSASGLWLVTPTTWLAMAALVFGYERHDLRRRFGAAASAPPLLALPAADDAPPDQVERLATLVLVFVPWLVAYSAAKVLGRPPDSVSTWFPGEKQWPVLTWMELPYGSAYVFVPLSVFTARSRRALRSFAESGIVATVVVTLCWLVIPVVATFAAFLALWPLLAARVWSSGRERTARAVVWACAILIVVSCVATGHHNVLAVAAATALYPVVRDVRATWAVVRRATERFANSWREWSIGPVRLINHAIFAGAAAAAGLTIAGVAAGVGRELAVVWVGLFTLIGAGAYAQILEGSPRLLRPFGWYGGLIGCVVGILTSPIVGGAVLPLMAAFALAAPWAQMLGRLRCLVQGCCHGSVAGADTGIRYRHPRSRVTHLAGLSDTPLYPTPLYSIAGNLVIGFVLIRLRVVGAPDPIVIGVYCILSGCARFVEEAFRGEPQTPVVAGLRIYQWFAGATLLVGIVFTMIPSAPARAGFHPPTPALLAWAVAMFVIYGASMGMDFPRSNRRFSRLASAD